MVRAVEQAAARHRGAPWRAEGFVDLNDRASHPCGILRGQPFSVFVKLDTAGGPEQFTAELRGLRQLTEHSGVATPQPVASGLVEHDGGALLLLEALTEVPAMARTPEQWRDIGRTIAAVHQVRGERLGLDDRGYFGPLRQDNRPVASGRWSDFYAQRRVLPRLRSARDTGYLPKALVAGVESLVARLPDLCGPEPDPVLLHGDAQQNNVLTTARRTVLLDPAPYVGHPETDLALIDYFEPVPGHVFDGYRDVAPIDPGFDERRELWRLHAYLAVVTVDGGSAFGRPFVDRIAAVVARYR